MAYIQSWKSIKDLGYLLMESLLRKAHFSHVKLANPLDMELRVNHSWRSALRA